MIRLLLIAIAIAGCTPPGVRYDGTIHSLTFVLIDGQPPYIGGGVLREPWPKYEGVQQVVFALSFECESASACDGLVGDKVAALYCTAVARDGATHTGRLKGCVAR